MRPRDLTPKKSMTRIENDENERGNTLDNKIITVL